MAVSNPVSHQSGHSSLSREGELFCFAVEKGLFRWEPGGAAVHLPSLSWRPGEAAGIGLWAPQSEQVCAFSTLLFSLGPLQWAWSPHTWARTAILTDTHR